MIKKIIILEVLVFVLILLTNSFIDKNSKMNISFNQIEALAQGVIFDTTGKVPGLRRY